MLRQGVPLEQIELLEFLCLDSFVAFKGFLRALRVSVVKRF